MTSYINTPPDESQVRQPRALLALGDILLDFEKVNISHSGTNEAGQFDAVIRSAPGNNVGQWNWWFSQSVIVLDVYFGLPKDPANYGPTDLTRLFTGRVDNIRLDVATNTITIAGRDLSAILIDKITSGQFQNQTSSQVAQHFAKDAGLDTNIQATTTKIGSFYTADHVQLMHGETQWAMLVYLARKEGVQCFVLGRTLYFGQFQNLRGKSYIIQFDPANDERPYPTSNAGKLDFEHDLTLSRDVIVTVKSWNAKNKKGFSSVAKASSGKAQAARSLTPILPKSAADAQNYVYTIPGLTPEQAKEKAFQIAKEISSHEIRMSAELPCDDLLYPWVNVDVTGTGTVFDATYYPSEVKRSLSPTESTMTMRAKNHQTGTEVALQ